MSESAEILKELYRSMVMGSMLGLFIKNEMKQSFIITKIKKIADDPTDPENKVISLPEKDIHGNVIKTNPIMSKDIINIRDFNRLRGIEPRPTK
jgi:hypothetical protein